MPRVKDGSKDWEDLSQTQGACPTCRSVIYAATDTGFWVCENGHQAAGLWTQEAEGGDNEDGNPGEQRSQLRSIPVGKRARRSRTLFRSEQEQLSGAQDDVFDYTSGLDGTKRGTLILLHALQFILRAQIDFVVEHYRLGSNEPGREVQFRENAKKYWLHFASTMHGMVIKPKARLLHNSESDDDISTDSRTTMEFFGKKPKIELLGQRHVLIVVYLALLSIEMPVFPADLSRLVKSELMPFHIDRTNRLIVPPKLLVGIDEFGMRSLFSSVSFLYFCTMINLSILLFIYDSFNSSILY